MSIALGIGLAVCVVSAFCAVALGRNLTRSLVSGTVFVSALSFMLLIAGAGYLSFVVAMLAALTLVLLQLFGWMLVDVDRDHLPAVDRPTRIARGLAFALFGGGLLMFFVAARLDGEFAILGRPLSIASSAEIGAFLFGPLREFVFQVGLAIGASLLAAQLLLRDDGKRG